MPTRKKNPKPKKDAAPTGAEGAKEAIDLADADDIHGLMSLNAPRVARWALSCVNRAARGRASLFQQKVALLMIQKCTPSTGRKEDEGDEIPEGATKAELLTLNRLIADAQKQGITHETAPQTTQGYRAETSYQVRQPEAD